MNAAIRRADFLEETQLSGRNFCTKMGSYFRRRVKEYPVGSFLNDMSGHRFASTENKSMKTSKTHLIFN